MTPYMILALVAYMIIFALVICIIHLKKTLKKPKTPAPSLELSDFLRDIQTHGYSFVRIDPDNVYMRK